MDSKGKLKQTIRYKHSNSKDTFDQQGLSLYVTNSEPLQDAINVAITEQISGQYVYKSRTASPVPHTASD